MFNRANLSQLAEKARQGLSQTASSLRESVVQRSGSPTRSRSVRSSQGVLRSDHHLKSFMASGNARYFTRPLLVYLYNVSIVKANVARLSKGCRSQSWASGEPAFKRCTAKTDAYTCDESAPIQRATRTMAATWSARRPRRSARRRTSACARRCWCCRAACRPASRLPRQTAC